VQDFYGAFQVSVHLEKDSKTCTGSGDFE